MMDIKKIIERWNQPAQTIRTKTKAPLGAVWYEGPSLYDGKQVRVVVNQLNGSSNSKTGMANVSVLPMGKPSQALREGRDHSVCGDCKLRGTACYVNLGRMGFDTTADAIDRGRYEYDPEAAIKLLEQGEGPVRFGAYGNMSAVPFEVTESILEVVGHRGWTMYVSDWRDCDQRFREFAMASCHTVEEAIEARDMGWRFFLAIPDESLPKASEQLESRKIKWSPCPNSQDSNIKCAACKLCDGAADDDDARASIINKVHGTSATRKHYRLAVLN